MQVFTHTLQEDVWTRRGEGAPLGAQLALAFAPAALLERPDTWERLRALHPLARIVACSTAGEIIDNAVHDELLACTGVRFDHCSVVVASARPEEAADCQAFGRLLAQRLPAAGLRHVFVLSEGLTVNGSTFAQGLLSGLPPGVAATGGLAADGDRFQHTVVCLDGPHPTQQAVAIGFYGERLRVGHGCAGGWEPFGIERRVTRSEGNVLWELDGEPALDLYRRYLGPQAADLPASGLLFPLAIRPMDTERAPLVRTILAMDETNRTLTFAGDVPMGHKARLMKSRHESLVDGAQVAGEAAHAALSGARAQLALLVSCVGRKIVMKQRVEEEIEAVCEALGPQATIAGFYSYGELSPLDTEMPCELHNQTMTVTVLAEV
jgi:hypothetical protein